jgi:hypothetical protein
LPFCIDIDVIVLAGKETLVLLEEDQHKRIEKRKRRKGRRKER